MGNVWQPESWCPPKVGIISHKRRESGFGETGAVEMADDMADAHCNETVVLIQKLYCAAEFYSDLARCRFSSKHREFSKNTVTP